MLERFREIQVKDHFFGSWALHLSFGTFYEVNIMQLCSFRKRMNRICKHYYT